MSRYSLISQMPFQSVSARFVSMVVLILVCELWLFQLFKPLIPALSEVYRYGILSPLLLTLPMFSLAFGPFITYTTRVGFKSPLVLVIKRNMIVGVRSGRGSQIRQVKREFSEATLVANEDALTEAARSIIRQCFEGAGFFAVSPCVKVFTQIDISQLEKDGIERAVLRAGAREVYVLINGHDDPHRNISNELLAA